MVEEMKLYRVVIYDRYKQFLNLWVSTLKLQKNIILPGDIEIILENVA